MPQLTSAHTCKILERAEGYLELASVDQDSLSLSIQNRRRLANRTLDCLREIRKPQGHKPYLLFLKGQACRLAERHREAIRYLEQSRRIDPDNIHLYFALAWSYKRCCDLEAAIQAMQTAVELDPENGMAHYNLACYYALDGQTERALMHLSFAFDLDSRYREFAVREEDFVKLRQDPRFATMTSVVV